MRKKESGGTTRYKVFLYLKYLLKDVKAMHITFKQVVLGAILNASQVG